MFSKTSFSSGIDNLDNVSLYPALAAICGYTDRDLDTVFAPEPEGLDRDEIRRRYNGYHWLGKERLYNPATFRTCSTSANSGNTGSSPGT